MMTIEKPFFHTSSSPLPSNFSVSDDLERNQEHPYQYFFF